MNSRIPALVATAAGTILAGSVLVGVAAAATGPGLSTALPAESTVSRIVGTQMAAGTTYFDTGVPLFGGMGVPSAPSIVASASDYARAVRAGGITSTSTFISAHSSVGAARARVLARTRSDKGTDVQSASVGTVSRVYDTPGGGVYARASIGTTSFGAFAEGKGVDSATLRRVAIALARQVAARAVASTSPLVPTVPVFLARVTPPTPDGWTSSGTLARTMSNAAVDSSPGGAALRTKGWGTFQNVMGLGQATGTTQVAVTNMGQSPATATSLRVSVVGIPFNSPDAAATMVRALPGLVTAPTRLTITVPGAAAAVAVLPKTGLGVAARVASPRGDLLDITCGTNRYGKVSGTACVDAITTVAAGWLEVDAA